MQRLLLKPAQVQQIKDHIATMHEQYVISKWESYLDNVQRYGFAHEDTDNICEFLGLKGKAPFSPQIFLRLQISMDKWLKNQSDADPPLDFIASVWRELVLFSIWVVGRCVRIYQDLPPVRVMCNALVFCLMRLIGICVLAWMGWTLLRCIWAIDVVQILTSGQDFLVRAWDFCVYADATFWSCMTLPTLPRWNMTLPRLNLTFPRWSGNSSWRRNMDVDTRLGALDARLFELERFTGLTTSDLLQQLSRNTTVHLGFLALEQHKKHAFLEEQMGGRLQSYEQKNANLTGEVQSLNTAVNILIKRLSHLEKQLARVEATGAAALIVAGATTIVGAATVVATSGFVALGKMALGYAVAALCEFGSLSVLVDEPIQ